MKTKLPLVSQFFRWRTTRSNEDAMYLIERAEAYGMDKKLADKLRRAVEGMEVCRTVRDLRLWLSLTERHMERLRIAGHDNLQRCLDADPVGLAALFKLYPNSPLAEQVALMKMGKPSSPPEPEPWVIVCGHRLVRCCANRHIARAFMDGFNFGWDMCEREADQAKVKAKNLWKDSVRESPATD